MSRTLVEEERRERDGKAVRVYAEQTANRFREVVCVEGEPDEVGPLYFSQRGAADWGRMALRRALR